MAGSRGPTSAPRTASWRSHQKMSLPPIGPRKASAFADRHRHVSAGGHQLLGQLDPGLAAAHEQDPARTQGGRDPVAVHVDLVDRRVEPGREGRDVRHLEWSAGYDHGPSVELAKVGRDAKAGRARGVDRNEASDLSRQPHRSLDRSREAPEVCDQVVARHVPVGFRPGVLEPTQLDHPVRRHEPEGVPPILPATAEGIPALEEHGLSTRRAGECADREPGLAGATDHGLAGFSHEATG